MKKRPQILIVDDDENIICMLRAVLNRDGYDVSAARNGLEALNIIAGEEINLVISDIRMPEMDGLAELREIKKRNPQMEVILMTAFGEVESYLKAMDLGAFDYFNKPIDFRALSDFVKKALQQHKEPPGV